MVIPTVKQFLSILTSLKVESDQKKLKKFLYIRYFLNYIMTFT